MPYTAIIKFIPTNNTDRPHGEVIHRVTCPSYGESGDYRHTLKCEGFRTGRRRNATKREKEIHHDGCVWAPWGLYYTLDWREEEWLERCESLRVSLEKFGIDKDDRLLPRIEHDNIDDFFNFIGFDRKTRKYVRKESPYSNDNGGRPDTD